MYNQTSVHVTKNRCKLLKRSNVHIELPYIVDRLNELIKVKDFQPRPPAELEALLLQQPHISDEAIMGIT